MTKLGKGAAEKKEEKTRKREDARAKPSLHPTLPTRSFFFTNGANVVYQYGKYIPKRKYLEIYEQYIDRKENIWTAGCSPRRSTTTASAFSTCGEWVNVLDAGPAPTRHTCFSIGSSKIRRHQETTPAKTGDLNHP